MSGQRRRSGQLRAPKAGFPPPPPPHPLETPGRLSASPQKVGGVHACTRVRVRSCVCVHGGACSLRSRVASLSVNTAASGLMLTGSAPLTEAAFGGLRRKEPGPHSGDTHVPVSTGRTTRHKERLERQARRSRTCGRTRGVSCSPGSAPAPRPPGLLGWLEAVCSTALGRGC